MALPLSKNQVRNLGKRLRDSDAPSPEDLDLLAEVLVSYDASLSHVVARLTELGLRTSSRLKNTGTIVEKLRRDRSSNLPNIQDLAGVRVFLGDDDRRSAQDATVARIVAEFADPVMPPRVSDRRAAPSQGYRAVHVVVYVGALPVEIQVRTRAQHEWAEYFERLADLWGRGIRYANGEPDVERALLGVSQEGRASMRETFEQLAHRQVATALRTADLIARVEEVEERERDDESKIAEMREEVRSFVAELAAGVDSLRAELDELG